MNGYICIHGHFYQPLRENPYLEDIELQDSAFPYHDWNERIAVECYGPNASSRILDSEGKIIEIVNNYSNISFDFGPTLLRWMEVKMPDVYKSILEADRLSMQKFNGHGSAIAQVYNHMIMPLANRRDKYTQIIWGVRDFQKRFKRFPEGIWLSETAVDIETLEILSELGVKFTVLAPHQACLFRQIGTRERWQDVMGARIDTTMAYLCNLPSGREINIFFYDGQISQSIAFGGMLNNGEVFAKRLLDAFSPNKTWPQLVNIATDGETYGHHHRFGDMALAYCVNHINNNKLANITIYGEYLEKHPPTHEVMIIDNTSWSCSHGIERWRNNCGCTTGSHHKWSQSWRKPLRDALNWLVENITPLYERETSKYLKDSWDARNDYIEVILDRSVYNIEKFLSSYSLWNFSKAEKQKILKLLELQRNSMLMYTSCGWFFDDVSRIETIQNLQYASIVIKIANEIFGIDLEKDFLQILEGAISNVPDYKNGALIYKTYIKPESFDLIRVGAHYAISSLFNEYSKKMKLYCYTANSIEYNTYEAGKLKLLIGRAEIKSNITLDEIDTIFIVLHLGEHNVNCSIRVFTNNEDFKNISDDFKNIFEKGNIPDLFRHMDKYFGTTSYTLLHLFKDEQRKILKQILESTINEIEVAFHQIYKKNYSLMNFLQEMKIPPIKPLAMSTEFYLNMELKKIFESEDVNIDLDVLENLIKEIKKWHVELDKTVLSFVVSSSIDKIMEQFSRNVNDLILLEKIKTVFQILNQLPIILNTWKAQNIYFSIAKEYYPIMQQKALNNDDIAKKWINAFKNLSTYLKVKVI